MEFLKVKEYILLKAAKAGDLAKVEQLTKNGADLDCTDSEGRTPFINAIIEDNILIAERLLELGADPEIIDKKGKTAFSYIEEKPKCDPYLRVNYSMTRASATRASANLS